MRVFTIQCDREWRHQLLRSATDRDDCIAMVVESDVWVDAWAAGNDMEQVTASDIDSIGSEIIGVAFRTDPISSLSCFPLRSYNNQDLLNT